MKKKVSLSIKLTVTMLLLLAGIIGLCWILNHTFLEQFYMYDKQKSLLETFEVLHEAREDGVLSSDEFDVTFENLCAKENLSILVVDAEAKVVRSSVMDQSMLFMQLQDLLRGDAPFAQSQVLVSTEEYTILRQNDHRLQSDFIVLWGQLGDGDSFVYIRSALESIRESARITNQFFIIVGLFGMAVGAVVIFFISRTISKPMQELKDVSKSMADLKFEVKYEPKQQDSTEVAELGEHMNFLSQTLEKTISDLKVANNELQKDIEKKEQIDEMRKEFLSNVSHELKTPIALIQGYAEGLKENINEDTESKDFYCDVIMDESDKMNRMVKKLLTLNQLEFGNDVVEMTRFNITEMIAGMVQTNQLLAAQDDIDIVFDEKEPVYVWGDEFKVEEVLTNYLSNALHHVAGEKQIRISFEQKDELLRVKVFNTGNPIPEEELDKIWVKFYKVDKARTREYGGSGIGLSIVKAIMDSMNRQCGARNMENGVEFWFELENNCTNSCTIS
ncbi:MAG: two-component sensor histidine kinase [Agathobacter sp.]|nr:two-component sensor histidine kinase [Agathobacter sp.]